MSPWGRRCFAADSLQMQPPAAPRQWPGAVKLARNVQEQSVRTTAAGPAAPAAPARRVLTWHGDRAPGDEREIPQETIDGKSIYCNLSHGGRRGSLVWANDQTSYCRGGRTNYTYRHCVHENVRTRGTQGNLWRLSAQARRAIREISRPS